MPKKRLTKQGIQSLKTTKAREFFWDTTFKLKGASFGVRVTKAGTKTYYIDYRNYAGKQRRIAVGQVGKISLHDARAEATRLLADISQGYDPAQERQNFRHADTVEQLCELYMQKKARPRLSPKTIQEYQRLINKEIIPVIGHYKACDVRRFDIRQIIWEISTVRKKQTLAIHTRSLLHAIFAFAVYEEILDSSPCAGLEKIKKPRPRDRFLSDDELTAFLTALEDEEIVIANLFKLLIHTAQRSGEVCGMRWSEIKANGQEWTIPKERSKNNKAHTVPLSPEVQKILRETKAAQAKVYFANKELRDFVFTSPNSKAGHITWLRKACERIREDAEVEHFTPHDLRRTATTGIRSLKVSKDVVSQILNHSQHDVTSLHYDYHDLRKEMTQALNKWSKKLESLTTKKEKMANG